MVKYDIDLQLRILIFSEYELFLSCVKVNEETIPNVRSRSTHAKTSAAGR